MQEIRTMIEDGQVCALNHDPVLDAKLKLRPDEVQLIIDICHFKGI